MLTFKNLTKRYGSVAAVNALSAEIPAGSVTAFVGPNGAGKSTTMRMLASLDRPTSGSALITGRHIKDLRNPLRTVGFVFDGRRTHAGRRAVDHLKWVAAANSISTERIGEVLEMCGIANVARRRCGALSLGMHQRLALATALLGDPPILVLDEPTNGLDPEGIVWMRNLLRSFADEGRTIFISSHLIAELAQVADRALIIGRGRLVADCDIHRLPEMAGLHNRVRVRTSQLDELIKSINASGVER